MSLKKEATVKRINFEEDWIDVKETRNYGDTVAAQKAASIRRTVSGDDKSGDDKSGDAKSKSDDSVVFEFDAVGFNLALLERMIVAWSDDDEITQETIQDLPDKIVQEVMSVITASLEDQDEDEKKD